MSGARKLLSLKYRLKPLGKTAKTVTEEENLLATNGVLGAVGDSKIEKEVFSLVLAWQ